MPRDTQQLLFEHFRSIALGSTAASTRANPSSSDDRVGITGSETSIPIFGNPPPPTSSEAPSAGNSGLGVAAEMFASGLGIASLVTGLMGIFGGGPSAPPVLTKYRMPQSLDFIGALNGSAISEANFNQIGTPRLTGTGADSTITAPTAGSNGIGSGAPAANPQISVTIHAMDAQSFMDRSSDIAQAVRQAMLNLSSINDVVNEL